MDRRSIEAEFGLILPHPVQDHSKSTPPPIGLLIAAVHLGLHWEMIAAVVRHRLGIDMPNKSRTFLQRALAIRVAGLGRFSFTQLDIASKLFIQMSLATWDFSAEARAFLLHRAVVIGLDACLGHCSMLAITGGKNRLPTRRAPMAGPDARSALANQTKGHMMYGFGLGAKNL